MPVVGDKTWHSRQDESGHQPDVLFRQSPPNEICDEDRSCSEEYDGNQGEKVYWLLTH